LIGPLSTTLGLEDLEDMIEVIMIDLHNKKQAEKIAAARRREEERMR
jgi:hypothetical protein